MRAGEDSATGVGVEDDKKMMLSLQYGVGPLNELAPIDQQRQAKARQEEEAKASRAGCDPSLLHHRRELRWCQTPYC